MVKRWSGTIRAHPSAGVAFVYAVITLLMTYPLGLRLGTHLFSSTNDFWIYPWNNWWVREALLEAYTVYRTPYLFYPVGAELFSHGFSWFNTSLWLPLQALLGTLAAHNITILVTYVVAGWTAYLLAHEITGSRSAAFVAGLIYAFYPHRYAHRGQLKLLGNQWMPLVGLFLVRTMQPRRLWERLGLAAALILCGLSGLHQLFLAGVWSATWLLGQALFGNLRGAWRGAWKLAVGVLVCLIILGPLLVPIVRAVAREPDVQLETDATPDEKRTDLLAFFIPPADHSALRIEPLGQLYEKTIKFGGPTVTIGWSVLVLAGLGVWRRREAAMPWLLSAVVLACLSLGSRLQINGRLLPVPLPYSLLRPTVIGTFIRHPNRFNIALGLPICVLSALGWEALCAAWGFVRRRGLFATLFVSTLIALEYSTIPVSTVSAPHSPCYNRLREEQGEFAVADFPIDMNKDKYAMYVQTLHQRPIVGGHVSRPPTDAHRFVEEVPLLRAAREELPD